MTGRPPRWLGWAVTGVLACGTTVAIRAGAAGGAAAPPSRTASTESPTTEPSAPSEPVQESSSTIAESAVPSGTPPAVDTVAAATTMPAVRPPAAGRYVYDANVDGKGTTAQFGVRSISGGRTIESLAVGGTTRRRVLRWSSSAVSVLSSGSCTYASPPPELGLPLAVDRTWRGTATCKTGSGTLTVAEQGRVLRTAVVRVEGRSIRVWVIERRSTMTARGAAGRVVRQTATTDLFAPDEGLVVYQTGRAATPDASGAVRSSSWTFALRSTSATSR